MANIKLIIQEQEEDNGELKKVLISIYI